MLSRADVFVIFQVCSPVANGLKGTVHLHINRKKKKINKERREKISYMLSRDLNNMK